MQKLNTKIAPPGARSNTDAILAELAERAGRHYGNSVASWLRCAAVLAEAREIADHGTWLPFLRQSGIPERTARRMLDFARADIQIGHLADLTRGEIAALIARAHRDQREYWAKGPDFEYAGCLVQAVIEVAQERGYDPGEFARFIAEFPDRPLPRAA